MIYGIKATLWSVRTSIYIQNINIRREAVDSDLEIVFLQLIYLQSKILDVRDVNFEISGTAFQSFDPLNIYFDSLSIDTYTLRNFAVIFTTCNYPEASLTGIFYANNITVFLSSPRILSDDAGIFNYIGPANVSFTGLDLSNWFARQQNIAGGVFITTGSGWVPNDGNIQLFNFANATLSLPNNPYSFLYNALYIVVDQNIYRISNITFDRYRFVNMTNSYHSPIFTIGNFGTDLYITNSILKDSSFYEIVFYIITFRNVIIYNNEFSNLSSVHFHIIGSYYCLGLNVNQNKFINLNFDKSSDYEAIVLGNLNITNTYIGNIYFYNVSLHGHPFVKSYDLIFKIVIENCYFNGIYQEDFNDLFAIGSVGGIIFNNNTFISISNSILSINKVDLSLNMNSQLSNLQISNSSATIIIFGNFINPTASVQTILVENITVFDSEISSNIDLITTERISSTASVNMIFNNFKFSGIKFANKGNLLLLKHNMPQEIIISNLILTNLTSSLITAESTGSDGTISVMHSKLVNWIFDQINNQFNSLINTNNKAAIEITNSSFSNIYSYEEGAILFAGQDKTSVTFSNWIFQNNSSVQGTIFVIESESLVQWINWTFLNNFGVEDTIFQTNLNGYFYFYNSSISNNYAINNPVGQLFDSASISILSNVSIYNNEAMSIEEVSSEFSIKCNKLWFVPKNLIQYITTNNKLALSTFKASLIQIVVSSLSIQNYSTLQNQNIMLNLFLSELKLINTSIYNVSSSIQASSSNVTIIGSSICEVINIDKTSFIFLDYNSILTINASILSNSTSSLINARNSEIIIGNLTITEVYSPSNLFQISNCDGVAINGLMINNWSTSNQEFINIDKSSNVQLSKFSGTKKNITFINILNSEVTSIDSFIINEFLQPLNIKSSIISLILNSSFANNGNRSLTKGGAISITDSQVSIRNTNFANNSAIIGGAISFECSGSSFWSLSIVNSIFESNTGASQGGAIYYNYYRPIINNVTFFNNYAIYGSNFASFAFKIKFAESNTDEMKIHGLVSGVEYNQTLKFSLEDFDNQTMVLNNVNLISISPINKADVSIRGISSVLVTKGVASFENFIATAKPGSSSIQFQVSSQAINYDKVKAVYNVSINNIMFADFRYWQPGEVQLADMSWSKWAPGTFSLHWNSTEWQQWLSNSVWEGGNQLNLDSGFWRKTINTSTIVQWLNPDAWSGGFINQEYGPTNCGVGYTGILWDSCQIENGVKYEKISDNTCSKWPSPVLNFIRVISLSLLVFAFISWIILINIRKTKESKMSVLFRILTNYLQIISSLLSFDIKYPTTISNLFVPLNMIGSSEVFLSFDCFVSDYNIKGPFPSNKIFKIFLTALLPGVLLILFWIIWIALRVIWRKLVPDLKRNIAISFISIIFLLHPRLVQNSIAMLQWVTIDNGDARAKVDLGEQWYSSNHIKLIFAISFPSLVVWVLGMPITALILLFKNFKKEESNKVKQYLLILYQGLRTEVFYWEFINTFIKAFILLIFIALSFLNQTVKIFLTSIFIFGIIRIQMKVSPYKKKENNFLEVRAMTASLLTLMVGIVFAQDTQIGFINIFFLLFVVFQNLWFLSEWLHLFWVCMGDRYKVFVYVSIFAHYLACLYNESYYFKEIALIY